MWPYDGPIDRLDPTSPTWPMQESTVELRAHMGHLDELRAHRKAIDTELAEMHIDRRQSWHSMDAAIDSACQEARLAVIAEIDRREAEVRSELDAAHARAVGTAERPRTLAEAQRQLVNARSGEQLARERLQVAYDGPGKMQRARRSALLAALASVMWVIALIVMSGGAWLHVGLGVLIVGAIAAAVIRWFDGRIAAARDDVPAAVTRHERSLHDLLVAEAAVMILGGSITG